MKMFLIIVVLLAAVSALAADPEPIENTESNAAGKNESAESHAVPRVSVIEAEKSSDNGLGIYPASNPLMPEINLICEQAKAQLVYLNSQLANQTNDAQALELIREIESVKMVAELDIMRLQADAAHARGDQKVADQIYSAIEKMTTPRPWRPAVERPAPAGTRN